MEHDNNKMSLGVYLSVEKPTRQLKRTLAMMHLESPIICVEKINDENIEVWSRQEYIRINQDKHLSKTKEVFNISTINTVNGEIVKSKKFEQVRNISIM